MKENPLVSIITPCYNSEAYIERYLQSILRQTYSRIQLIIINDGSKDRTEEIVQRFIPIFEENEYILTYVSQENKGLGGAINTGLKHIKGEYFAWCDSDNFYTDDYVETKVNYFESHKDCAVLRCDGYVVHEKDIHKPLQNMAEGKTYGEEDDLFINMIMEKNFHFGCAMIRTEAFDAVNPEREIYPSREGQNWQLLLPVFYRYKAHYIDKPMFYFVYRATSVSNCTSGQGLPKKLEQIQEYEKIIRETISSIAMPESERNLYLNMVKSKYVKARFYLALQHKNNKLVAEEFGKLKQLGICDLADRINYYRSRSCVYNAASRVCSFILRGIRFIFIGE